MNNKFLSSTSLKLIAITIMIIDHIAAVDGYNGSIFELSYEQYLFMRLIGRLAFPIFAFLIAEGYFYTKNIKKYILRLGIFAVVSEVVFDLAFTNNILEFNHQNIFFTLTIGLIALFVFNYFREKQPIIGIIFVFIFSIIAELLHTDYSLYGVWYIFAFYVFRNNFLKTSSYVLLINVLYLFMTGNMLQFMSIFALVIIYFYNHKKGKNIKYLFYSFYPLHLIILYLLKYLSTKG